MKKQFYKERKKEISQLYQNFKEEILTEEKLLALPKALQTHFRLSGFLNNPIAMNADFIWKDSFIKLKPNQNWKPLQTLQFNSVNPIMRISFMKVVNMFFTGKDYYKNGQGTMKGKIFNLFTILDAKGKELSQSALITSFCEMMMLSGYAFQKYVEWEEIDQHKVKGILTEHGFKVSGFFNFDEEGKFTYFESNDRYYDLEKGNFEKKKFIARVNSYRKVNDYYQPENISAIWVLDNEEYEYFKGSIEKIEYNVK